MKLSVAIAVHNEEKNILRTLESVYDWVDEIVVVDGESTDKTVNVIEKRDMRHKIRIFHEKNPAMFHENKQIAIAKCKGEWILQLDADEVVSVELKEEIENVILSDSEGPLANASNADKLRDSSAAKGGPQNDKVVAYWIPRLNFFLGKPLRKGGQYPDYTIRLYKNGVAHFPCKSVHEQVEINSALSAKSAPRIAGSAGSEADDSRRQLTTADTGFLKSDLFHYPYPTFEDYLQKWVRYGVLEAAIWKQQGIKPSFANSIKYMIVLPKWWFFKTYIRHRGYTDGFPGFVFSLFSSIRYWITYIKLCEITD
jgi:glycosyltransferase involved in cell wall biosynthesis